MIFNKRWKKELKKLSRTIKFWSRFHAVNEYAMYQLTRAVIYSAMDLVGMANIGTDLLPAEVVFRKIKGKLYADIL